jgi:hypothetical protein
MGLCSSCLKYVNEGCAVTTVARNLKELRSTIILSVNSAEYQRKFDTVMLIKAKYFGFLSW